MKNFTFSLLALLFVSNAFAQMPSTESPTNDVEAGDINGVEKEQYSSWFSYVDAARQYGVSWTRITNATLFPDSAVYQGYSDELGKTNNLSVGQVLDPQDPVFTITNKTLSNWNAYVVDSVQILFRYAHNIPGTKDTLRLHFHNNVRRTTLSSSGRTTATVSYDKVNNHSLNPAKTLDVIIDENHVTDWDETGDYYIMNIAVPDGGVAVERDQLFALTMSYVPGYSYEEGDTIQHDWEPAPTKKLNHLIAPLWRDNDQSITFGYNTGLKATRGSRYTSDIWNGDYIAGHAWNDYDENLYFSFHLSTENLSAENRSIDQFKMYPNPAAQNNSIYVKSMTPIQLITVTDPSGKVISVTKESNEVNTDFATGVYFITVKTDKGTSTQKLTVH